MNNYIDLTNNDETTDENTFNVTVDGITKEATLITILDIDSREFAVYSIDSDEENADILFSEIIKDDNGLDKLVDVDDIKIKEKVVSEVNKLFV